jgi:hypothetical protein
LIFSERTRHEPEASCKKLSAGEIPTELNISQDPNKQPFWLKFDERDFSNVLPFGRGPNSLSLIERNKTNLNHTNYYTLHKKPASLPIKVSPYSTELTIDFDYRKSNSVLNNKQLLSVAMSAKSYRETKLIVTTTTQDELTVNADILMLKTKSAGRKNLVQLKDNVQSVLTEMLDAHMRALECVDINPLVTNENNQLMVNHGALDGLEQHDLLMFTDSGMTRDFYKIIRLDDYKAKIAPVSANPRKLLSNGDQLDIISGQS